MASRHSDQRVKLPATLAGLSLAISIAREATDAVPVVKQSLGAALRILALADKIDKDREALHALADRSLQLAQRVKEVVGSRTPDANILATFERIHKAFDAIEDFMRTHATRSRLRRAIGLMFTVPLHVERLSRELSDAVQELVVVVLLDVNQQVRDTHSIIESNARYVGEFRLLRHCEVDKLEVIREESHYEDDRKAVVRYYRARVDGQLLVVRHFEGVVSRDSDAAHTTWETVSDRILSCDRMLEELSSVQRSHRNVARIYGWSNGPIHDRFTVFKSGFRDAESLSELPNAINTVIHWVFKLLDAAHHLRRLGISWKPTSRPCFALDDHLEPTIGLQNDLYRIEPGGDLLSEIYNQICYAIIPIWAHALWQWRALAAADVRAAVSDCHNEWVTNLFDRIESFHGIRCVMSKADFSNKRIIGDETAQVLLRSLEEYVQHQTWRAKPRTWQCWTWADILLALDNHHIHQLTKGLHAFYTPQVHGLDSVEVHGLDEDSERIVFDQYTLFIPHDQSDRVRKMFGIPAPSEDDELTHYLIVNGGPGTYRAPE